MNTLRLSILLALMLFSQLATTQGQTLVMARPVSDAQGMIAFEITEIIKVEGYWKPELAVGELLRPQKRQKAHPIMRFGEAVVIALTEPSNRTKWQGLHVHNGCIPALQGKPLEEFEEELEKQIHEEALAKAKEPTKLPAGPGDKVAGNAKPGQKPAAGPEKFAICPICKQRHIRIR